LCFEEIGLRVLAYVASQTGSFSRATKAAWTASTSNAGDDRARSAWAGGGVDGHLDLALAILRQGEAALATAG